MAEPSAVPAGEGLPAASEPRETAVPKLVSAHAGRLFALSRGFCGDDEEARDVVQETFLKAWRSWEQFDGRASPATWLYRIAARTCGAMRRKRSGEPDALLTLDEPELAGLAEEEVDPGADLEREEGLARIERAVAGLPEEFRLPLVLQAYAGLPLDAIGRILEIPAATAKTRVHRARERLRAVVDAPLPGDGKQPERFSTQVCLDLLRSAMAAQDNGLGVEFPLDQICERCAETFASLDFGTDACRHLGRRAFLESVAKDVLELLERSS